MSTPNPALVASKLRHPSTGFQDIRLHNHADKTLNHVDTCLRCKHLVDNYRPKGASK